MDFSLLLGLLESLAAVVALALFFFFYFRNENFKKHVHTALTFLPTVLSLLGRWIKDKPGVFDAHDASVLLGRVSAQIRATIEDPANKTFEDVEDEVFDIVRDELRRYAGLPGVPNLDDPVVKTQVRVVFEAVQRAMSEDPA